MLALRGSRGPLPLPPFPPLLPALRVPQPLAYRNLLYTGITRARELLVTVGTARQIEAMAANDRETRRYSALAAFLKAAF